ncbi:MULTISPECIES: AAA family ATPase [unclassified Moraxella]|uniref:AAA family ATPase n=1 Tax=unclassified Moraxella TaxID=2685852 RepID=UPI003AF587E7
MRILTLTFQNLNSLKGEWHIDFRHPAYANEGIFAITGATGAGKSTILDAICLALYGATPRLGDITQNKNDLMSRYTGECFSEVVFATHTGSYRCHWGQKRARKSPDGKLQSPKHEIAEFIDDHTQGKILEEKANLTKKQVEAITGMDFARFTRAMLLAQGSFSAFLQASSDERSPILEQITGTEIYSDISKKVHEFNRNADLALSRLTDKLDNTTVLSDEEEQILIGKKSQLLAQVTQRKTEIATLEQDKLWRNNLNTITAQLVNLTQQKSKLQQKTTEFAPQQIRLQRAFKALQIAGDVNQLGYISKQLTSQTADLTGFQQQLPTLTEQCQTAKLAWQQHHALLTTAEQAISEAEPLFNHIRELDSQRGQQQQQYHEANEQLGQLQGRIAKQQQAFGEQQQRLTQLENEQQQCLAKQQQIPNADELPQHLATLKELQKHAQTLNDEKTNLSNEQTRLKQQHANNQQIAQQLSQTISQLDSELNTANAQQHSLEQTLATLTNGQSIGELRQQGEQLWHAQNQANAIKQAVSEWQTNHTQSQQQQHELGDIATQLSDLTQQLTATNNERHHAEQRVDLLNRNLILLAKIQDLTQERERLIHGEPCPLCGATAHPFAHYQPTDTNDSTQQQWQQAKTQLEQLNQRIQQLRIEQNTLQQREQFLQQQISQLNECNQQLTNQLQADIANLPNAKDLVNTLQDLVMSVGKVNSNHPSLKNPFDEFLIKLAHYQQTIDEQSKALQQRLTHIEQQQTAYQTAQRQLAKLSEQHNQQLQQQTRIHSEQQHCEQRLGEIGQLLASNSDNQQQLQQRIDGLFAPFITPNALASDNQSQVTFEQRLANLENIWQQFQQLNQTLQQLNDHIIQAKQTLISLDSEKQNLSNNLAQWQQKHQTIGTILQDLNQQREREFGDKSVEAEQLRLTQAKNQAFQAWRNSEQALNELTQQQTLVQQHIETLNASITQLQASHGEQQRHVNERLQALGFIDEADYQSAMLADSERDTLQRLANELLEQQQRIDSLLTQAQTQQHALLATPRTELDFEQITELLDKAQFDLSQTQQELGGVEQLLASNQQLKHSQIELLQQIEQQRLEVKQWKDLHELIGSNDGKKFRNFAQGLTFNIMIAHANEQLRKMSDRYLLLANDKEPLMLDVMDNYQGGQVRTSKNLSGGESFIISLALALGLSNMASHRMQVDSLFLDEGFGTLDEEALDVALDTLTGLQQSGKLIGVISHIQALKDRISSQIQVVPMNGGVSQIVGMGVKQGNIVR